MSFALFHYTLLVLLAVILTAAVCLSAYLVSRKSTLKYAFAAFIFYFFDVTWVFQRDFFSGGEAYSFVVSLVMIAVGCGFLTSFWLLVCDYLGRSGKVLRVAPAVAFAAASLGMLLLPESGVQSFLFYLPRELYLFWMLLFALFHYLALKDEAERVRLRRHALPYAVMWVLGASIVVEDALVFLLSDPILFGLRAFAPERNISENVLMLCCAFLACRDAFRVLALRFERPPMKRGDRQETRIDDNLQLYGSRHQLSAREQEVLRYVLMGYDNQNIASSMHLALSTVKVHVHNILQKTNQPNRQALAQDFWKMS